MTKPLFVDTDGPVMTVTFSLRLARSAAAVSPFLLITLGTITSAGPAGSVAFGFVSCEVSLVSNVRHSAAPLVATASNATTNAPTKIVLILGRVLQSRGCSFATRPVLAFDVAPIGPFR